ncbi:hypothetical protein DMENIID0001_093740 [Sergentomyia squamirostris]
MEEELDDGREDGRENGNDEIANKFGDLPPNAMDYLSVYVNHIQIPLLTNPDCCQRMPSVVQKEVHNKLQKLKDLLDVPDAVDFHVAHHVGARDFLTQLEKMVCKWSNLVEMHVKISPKVIFEGNSEATIADEYNFWSKRRDILHKLNKFHTSTVQAIKVHLEDGKSVYLDKFQETQNSLDEAIAEADDISLHLTPLMALVDLTGFSLSAVDETIPVIFQAIFLVWHHSKYYRSDFHITRLCQLLDNVLLLHIKQLLHSDTMFSDDVENILHLVRATLVFLHKYRETLMSFKSRLTTEAGAPVHMPIESHTYIFLRERLDDIQALMQISLEYTKLERLEFGEILGKENTRSLKRIFDEFQRLQNTLSELPFNPLDIDQNSDDFQSIRNHFHQEIEWLDEKIATQIERAFSRCNHISKVLQILKSMGDFIKRPIIYKKYRKHFPSICQLFDQEIDAIDGIFEMVNAKVNHGEKFLLNGVVSSYSGLLVWINQLKSDLKKPFNELYLVVDSEEIFANHDDGERVMEKFENVSKKLSTFDEITFTRWRDEAIEMLKGALAEPLLQVNATGIPSFNINDNLSVIMRDIRIIEQLEYDVPVEIGCEFLERFNSCWMVKNQLLEFIEKYRFVREKLNVNELAVIADELAAIDEGVTMLIDADTWGDFKSPNIQVFAKKMNHLHGRMMVMLENKVKVTKHLQEMKKYPVWGRKDEINSDFIVFSEREKILIRWFWQCMKLNKVIKEVLVENFGLLTDTSCDEEGGDDSDRSQEKLINPRKRDFHSGFTDDFIDNFAHRRMMQCGEEIWKIGSENAAFVKYKDSIDKNLLVELKEIIKLNLNHIEDDLQNASKERSAPIIEIILRVKDEMIIFEPSMEINSKSGLYMKFKGLISDIVSTLKLVVRVNDGTSRGMMTTGEVPTYWTFRESIREIDKVKKFINNLISEVMVSVNECYDQYITYEEILRNDKASYIKAYVENGTPLPFWKSTQSSSSSEFDHTELKQSSIHGLQFQRLNMLYEVISTWKPKTLCRSWLILNSSKLKQDLLEHINQWTKLLKVKLQEYVSECLQRYKVFFDTAFRELTAEEIDWKDFERLKRMLKVQKKIATECIREDNGELFKPLIDIVNLLKSMNIPIEENILEMLESLPREWVKLKMKSMQKREDIKLIQQYQMDLTEKRGTLYLFTLKSFSEDLEKSQIFHYPCPDVYTLIDDWFLKLTEFRQSHKDMADVYSDFSLTFDHTDILQQVEKKLKNVKQMWDFVIIVDTTISALKRTLWSKVDIEEVDQECRLLVKHMRSLDKSLQQTEPIQHCDLTLRNLMASLRTLLNLKESSLRDRHWRELQELTEKDIRILPRTNLNDLLSLDLIKNEEDVREVVDKSAQEEHIEINLKTIREFWEKHKLDYEENNRLKMTIPKWSEELFENLDEHQIQLQNMVTSRYIGGMVKEAEHWRSNLERTCKVLNVWFEVQQRWLYMETIFMQSKDIRERIPRESEAFATIDGQLRKLVGEIRGTPLTINITRHNMVPELGRINDALMAIEKVLNEYLEGKRKDFPRFYFISSVDLLDILTSGEHPREVFRHLLKLFDSVKSLQMDEGQMRSTVAKGMLSREDEYVEFKEGFVCLGAVEVWLNRLIDEMRQTLRHVLAKAVAAYVEKSRCEWIGDWPAQSTLCATQIWWSTEVERAFRWMEQGQENAMKKYQKRQIEELSELINMLIGELTVSERQKIMTISTISVHSRDVVGRLIGDRVDNAMAFQWQSQLRHHWDEDANDCFANICDAHFRYDYEYLGNTPRLVVTPLTDKCYITLTQSLHLFMGGAPAGPAGTGKTETTKDLGRALGMMVYVFNCSEQMDYKSCGNIYKGLAQTGAFGCFDEFNRISVEVLSVVAIQVKTILDALKADRMTFNFLGDTIKLVSTVGIFITMNPGYAGRTELPENLKSLFRPCSMVVPDIELICEILLVAEGFQSAKSLARKFISLYSMCRELLSKQDHYDWGLRAVKSVLLVAGSLKRAEPQRSEDEVLMRALRDFNTPKITVDDTPVFLGLIGDLFPSLDVPRKQNAELEVLVKQAGEDLKLQSEVGFVQKVIELEEILQIRHSVFIIGDAGVGKSSVWKTLQRVYERQKLKPMYSDLNPKAVTNDELFGVVHPATREWQDGLFSIIMRDQAYASNGVPKWIIFDGDIDPMWIESLNTVMDDNKVLTLANNERIPLTPSMRLVFEIGHLRAATPATVSRAGILYINNQDVGYNPVIVSWIDKRQNEAEKIILNHLFNKYVPVILEAIHNKFHTIIPLVDVALVQSTCSLLNSLLTSENLPQNSPNEWYEVYFVFAAVWSFGGTLCRDQQRDWRSEFHRWWVRTFKTIKFPTTTDTTTVFDYHVDPDTKRFVPWSSLRDEFKFYPEIPLQVTFVDTNESVRLQYLLELYVRAGHPAMIVGGGGCGKTMLVQRRLTTLPSAQYMSANIPVNLRTSVRGFQEALENYLEKSKGGSLVPRCGRKLIYFVDDINLPQIDNYGTVAPHTLLRQFFDYKHWYEREKFHQKTIQNCSVVATLNPNVGSFTINPRLQRHFATIALSFPQSAQLQFIYSSILEQHLGNKNNKFPTAVQDICQNIVKSVMDFHSEVCQFFLPTSTKFHYNFNLHDITNVMQGLLFTHHASCKSPEDLFRIMIHEFHRAYGDKLNSGQDLKKFENLITTVLDKAKDYLPQEVNLPTPLIYFHYANGLNDAEYSAVNSWQRLNVILEEAQVSFREIVGSSNLVLFEDAMSHVCRIIRIFESTRGNVMLVGVGGSGKKSLTQLSGFIASLPVVQIQLSSSYGVTEFKSDLVELFKKTGVKTTKCCLMMSDAQIPTEEFVMIINDVLTTGECVNLMPEEEMEEIVQHVRPTAKQHGVPDDRANCWRFFIDRVRNNLKVVLCFSPVGDTLRQRARKYPGIFSNCRINWFHDWPQEALVSVAKKFLTTHQDIPVEMVENVSLFLAQAHISVNSVSQMYRETDKRFNYTTPKTFLDTIDLYRKLFKERQEKITQWINRLDQGLVKLEACTSEVDVLKATLAEQNVLMMDKKDKADQVLEVLEKENALVSLERKSVAEEEQKVRITEENIAKQAALCEDEVKKAEPAILEAAAALDTLDKKNLTELKSFGTPPPGVEQVTQAVLVLFGRGQIPKDRSWRACRAMMGKADTFLSNLKTFDKENIKDDTIAAIQPYLTYQDFHPDKMRAKSSAAAGLCAWVININKFHQVYSEVKPKLKALNTTREQLTTQQMKLAELNGKLKVLEDKLSILNEKLQLALAELKKCQDDTDRTANALDLADRLIAGLASERIRWKTFTVKHHQQMNTTLGDTLIAACFISYMGCFTQKYREKIIHDYWASALVDLEITTGEDLVNLNPFLIICDDAMAAEWNNEGLPIDTVSMDNAMILLNSVRWPLMIDPQLQGIKWIKGRYGDELVVAHLDASDCLSVVERVVMRGGVLLLENVGESLSSTLRNLFGRVFTRGGQTLMLGDREIDYNPTFRLILHTKLTNPHYQPEIQAQLTLINFTVTRDGLEDQLLVDVVKLERPKLEEQQRQLSVQRNVFKIQLKGLEDKLLERLSGETGNILENSSLVENVEANKKLAEEIEIRSREARETAVEITAARELYRDVARRAAILYFILMDLHKVNPVYQYSMEMFRCVFVRAIDTTEKNDIVRERVNALVDNITYHVYNFVSRGLFKHDKWLLIIQITLQIYVNSKEYNANELAFLLRFPTKHSVKSPVSFLSDANWGAVCTLAEMDNFRNIDRDIKEVQKRWKSIVTSEMPEKEKFPGDWRNINIVQKLCILRILRPDRMSYALYHAAIERLGQRFENIPPPTLSKIFLESSARIPIFFILSPGVDPISDVESLGREMKFTLEDGNCHIVSLGQGQEISAEEAIARGAMEGHWVILQNIHLVARWLPTLEKCIEVATIKPHESFRLFLSAEPATSADFHILPQGILESAIKVTNEPPSGIHANLHGALNQFTQVTLEASAKEMEFRAILFAMCYFHAIVGERRKFGPAGWNRPYPFNYGDLTFSSRVLLNYLEDDLSGVPWDDLRYMFGEIIYGGHITDDWDKRLCKTYLEEFLQPSLVEHDLEFCPGFQVPGNLDYHQYHEYIDEHLRSESPYMYGLHPNIEIVVEASKADDMFDVLLRLQPHSVMSSSATEGATRQDVVCDIVDDFLDRCHSGFDMEELHGKARNLTPYTIVALQECERMNVLWREIKESLQEMKLGLTGELTMSTDMEELEEALFTHKIPIKWTKRSYPSLLGLQIWYSDLLQRALQLELWTTSFNLPPVVWLGGFFNPQSLLTAIMQQTARRKNLALDRMSLSCDVTNKTKGEILLTPQEGLNIHGLFMEGAQWDSQAGSISEATIMKLTEELPVVYLKAVVSEKQEKRSIYECPLYRNRSRGPTYIWTFNLKTKEKASKWILGGVCLLLEK